MIDIAINSGLPLKLSNTYGCRAISAPARRSSRRAVSNEKSSKE
jgi:hypothetical protein